MGRGGERFHDVRCVKGVQFSVSCSGSLVGYGCGWSEDNLVYVYDVYYSRLLLSDNRTCLLHANFHSLSFIRTGVDSASNRSNRDIS